MKVELTSGSRVVVVVVLSVLGPLPLSASLSSPLSSPLSSSVAGTSGSAGAGVTSADGDVLGGSVCFKWTKLVREVCLVFLCIY